MDVLDWIIGAEGGFIITAGGYAYRVFKKKADKILSQEKLLQEKVDESQDLKQQIKMLELEVKMLTSNQTK